jgi:hypothetical protein
LTTSPASTTPFFSYTEMAREMLLAAYMAMGSSEVTMTTLSAKPWRRGAAKPPQTTSPRTSKTMTW